MAHHFKSARQENSFNDVLRELKGIGFGQLVSNDYEFPDYFSQGIPVRTAPAAAFAQTPFSYDNACFAVVLANGKHGAELISEYRSLGAPRAFEIREDRIIHWRVSTSTTEEDRQEAIKPSDLSKVFRDNANIWHPSRMLAAKTVVGAQNYRTDFIDLGLIPALESHVKAKLGPLLQNVLFQADQKYRLSRGRAPDEGELTRLLFRVLAGKIMHDRGEPDFRDLTGAEDSKRLLDLVAAHYGDHASILADSAIQKYVTERLWRSFSFKNLSVEVLAFIWEHTLVTEDTRSQHGIHATPPNVARYMVHRLPFQDIPRDERVVVEPCCGSGTFLVAALNRLRELLPPETPQKQRHDYFKSMLHGFDVEEFGLEVAKSCLMLADYPNPDGWNLTNADLLAHTVPAGFVESLEAARIVLCNPPFERLANGRKKRPMRSFVKGGEILDRVLDHLNEDGVLGFVLPAKFVDGQFYRKLRGRLAQRYSRLEVVHLPEGTFLNARFPSIIILAQSASSGHETVELTVSRVRDATTFIESGLIDSRDTLTRSVEEATKSLEVVELLSVWKSLESSPTLGNACKILQRGVEWHSFDRDKHISDRPRPGFVPGFHTADDFWCFEPPPVSFLWDRLESRKYLAWNLPWGKPKVVMNAVRKSQGPWRLAACPVNLNIIASQNFTVAWPKPPWTAKSLAAVLNGPVASAYASTHEPWKHTRKQTLKRIPVPRLEAEQIATLDKLVDKYMSAAALARDFGRRGAGRLFSSGPSSEELLSILIEIDSIVLHAYGLSESHLFDLRDYFSGYNRPLPFPYDFAAIIARPLGRRALREYVDKGGELLKQAVNEDRLSARDRFR